jgi:hypothetical protein
MKPSVFLSLLALASMTGCTGDFPYAVLGHPNSPCAPPQGTQSVLAYPANGSTGIPDNVGQIIFASAPNMLPGNYRAYLIDETSGEQIQVNFQGFSTYASLPPLPQPASTPPFSNPFYQASQNGGQNGVPFTFAQGHVISVHLQQQKCNTSNAYGSFTVQ